MSAAFSPTQAELSPLRIEEFVPDRRCRSDASRVFWHSRGRSNQPTKQARSAPFANWLIKKTPAPRAKHTSFARGAESFSAAGFQFIVPVSAAQQQATG